MPASNRLHRLILLLAALVLIALPGCAASDSPAPDPDGDATDGDDTNPDDTDGDDTDPDDPDGDDTNPDDPSEPLTRLRAEGTDIVDADGNIVRLMGVNLGGWLFNETWITQVDYSLRGRIHMLAQQEGFAETLEAVFLELGRNDSENLDLLAEALAPHIGEDAARSFVDRVRGHLPTVYDDSDLPLRRKLAERFGPDTRDELLDIFQQAWLTEADIAWIAGQGFTVVRVPIGYRSLITGPDLDLPEELVWNERAWARISELLDWCETHRIYAVLDIQESPGGHNAFAGEARLFTEERMQELTVQLWEEFSRRYHDRDVVAAYSLLAEPFGAPNAAARDAVYDKLVKAIRALGDDHLLVIHDGFFGMGSLPDPSDMGWEGVIYSSHIFEFDATSLGTYQDLLEFFYNPTYTRAQKRQQVPYYVASFSTRWDEPWAYEAAELLLSWYTENAWSWSVWTYKRIEEPLDVRLWSRGTNYGVLRLEEDFVRPDVFNDDLATLRQRMAGYADLPMTPNPELLRVLKAAL